MRPNIQRFFGFALIALAAIISYWPGLTGPLLFDDGANLEPVRRWLQGELSWFQIVFGNESGPLGRPISMASFLVNARLADGTIWGLKFGNLLIHLVTGGLIYVFFQRVV